MQDPRPTAPNPVLLHTWAPSLLASQPPSQLSWGHDALSNCTCQAFGFFCFLSAGESPSRSWPCALEAWPSRAIVSKPAARLPTGFRLVW